MINLRKKKKKSMMHANKRFSICTLSQLIEREFGAQF